ncbi:MAG: hypothetical protein AAF368_19100 [Planctomycetota bacterium]
MTADDLRALFRRQPFLPMRVHMTNGAKFDVSHPDQGMVYDELLIVGSDQGLEHCALMNIAHVTVGATEDSTHSA